MKKKFFVEVEPFIMSVGIIVCGSTMLIAFAIGTHFNNRQFSWSEAIRNGGNTVLKGIANYGTGMAMGVAGAYNYLLNGAPNRTFGKKLVDGIGNGIISNCLKLFQFPWYYIV